MTCYEKELEAVFACAPRATLRVIAELEYAGYPTYFVGGCVRDALSGTVPHDYDLATAASTSEMIDVLPYRHYDAGLKHGTVTFVVDGECIEVTMFRRESSYVDGRHPEIVEHAGSITEDLARRDFTMNAMGYSPTRGFIDPFGGTKDLDAGIIRCVGEPDERFTEDGLRIMRLMRFACCMGLEPEEATLESAIKHAGMLTKISRERIASELTRALSASDPGKIADVLERMIIVVYAAIPEMGIIDEYDQMNRHHDRDLLHHTLDVLRGIETRDPIIRLAALLHDVGKPGTETIDEHGEKHFYGHVEESARITERVAESLRLPKSDAVRLEKLVHLHDTRPTATAKSVRRFIKKCGGVDDALSVIELAIADIHAHAAPYRDSSELEHCREMISAEADSGAVVRVTDLAVDGTDLIDELGYKPDKELGMELCRLLDAVIDGSVPNEHAALLAAARRV